jgi:hypothetical protein
VIVGIGAQQRIRVQFDAIAVNGEASQQARAQA